MKIEAGKGTKLFKMLSYVLPAVSKDATRYVINKVLLEDNTFIATNGMILNVAKTLVDLGCEPGKYEVIKANKSEIILLKNDEGNFPKWQEFVPTDYTKYFTTCWIGSLEPYNMASLALAKKDIFIHPLLLKTAVADHDGALVFYTTDTNRPAVVKYTDLEIEYTSIVMPVNIDGKINYQSTETELVKVETFDTTNKEEPVNA